MAMCEMSVSRSVGSIESDSTFMRGLSASTTSLHGGDSIMRSPRGHQCKVTLPPGGEMVKSCNLYSVDKVDVAPEMEKRPEWATLASAAHLAH